MSAPVALRAEVGRRGLAIPLAAFRERVGGEAALRKILGALTVREKAHPGKPKGMAGVVRRAYAVDRAGAGGAGVLLVPRVKGPLFLRGRTRAGRPLLDEICEAPPAGEGPPLLAGNSPLPRPRPIPEAGRAPASPLYPYQAAAVDFLCGEGGALGPGEAVLGGTVYLQMDTGLGKSRVGVAVVARRGEPALVVVPTEAIAEQWVEEARESYPGLRAGVFRNPPAKSRRVPPSPATHDLVVVIVNTFRAKPPEFLAGYGMVILDEVHEYHSEHNSKALWLAQTRAVLGLSATPEERPDGLDRYVNFHLGPVLRPRDIPGFDTAAVGFTGEVRVVEYSGHPDYCETATTPAGTMSAILTIGNVLRDPARLRLVAAEVEKLHRRHLSAGPAELGRAGLGPRPAAAATPTHPAGEVRRHGVFVFAETRAYLPALRAALEELLGAGAAGDIMVPELDDGAGAARAGAAADNKDDDEGDDEDGDEEDYGAADDPAADDFAADGSAGGPGADSISILRGGVARTAVGDAKKAGAHIVLTTYGFSRRGISLPDMTAIVFATPRRNGSRQILGRALRRGSDESIVRQFVDIVDVRTGLRGQLADRRKVYKEKGYPITKEAVSWEAFPGEAPPAPPDEAPPAGGLAQVDYDELLKTAVGGR